MYVYFACDRLMMLIALEQTAYENRMANSE